MKRISLLFCFIITSLTAQKNIPISSHQMNLKQNFSNPSSVNHGRWLPSRERFGDEDPLARENLTYKNDDFINDPRYKDIAKNVDNRSYLNSSKSLASHSGLSASHTIKESIHCTHIHKGDEHIKTVTNSMPVSFSPKLNILLCKNIGDNGNVDRYFLMDFSGETIRRSELFGKNWSTNAQWRDSEEIITIWYETMLSSSEPLTNYTVTEIFKKVQQPEI